MLPHSIWDTIQKVAHIEKSAEQFLELAILQAWIEIVLGFDPHKKWHFMHGDMPLSTITWQAVTFGATFSLPDVP